MRLHARINKSMTKVTRSIIVDSHAHIFPPLGGPSGFASRRGHARYLQHQMSGHHMPIRRTADNAIVPGQTLIEGDGITLDGLTDVDFPAFRRRLWAYLQRRGYSPSVARRAILRLWDSQQPPQA